MHKSSLNNMKRFVKNHLKAKGGSVLDVGSLAVNGGVEGSYRPLFNGFEYVGVDLSSGPNVDVVMGEPYKIPFEDNSFDVVISGQALEHVEFFWDLVKEMARVLKPGGKMCLIAPSAGKVHRYPVDCWRFYEDGMVALAKYVGLNVVECYIDPTEQWRDCVLIGEM